MTLTDIEVRHERGERKGKYSSDFEGYTATLTYTLVNGHTLIIDHVGVPDALRGKGLGQLLVGQVVNDARETGREIVPLCPFAKAQFDRTPEWQDVLRKPRY